MEERARGIILRTRPLTETSVIAQWLTEEAGRLATVAKGARRPKSPFAGKLDLFFEGEFSFQRSRRSELHALREVRIFNYHAQLRKDLIALHQGSYFCVLIEQLTETETPIPEIFSLLKAAINALEATPPSMEIVFAFELRLLRLLGYDPELGRLQPLERAAAERLLENAFAPDPRDRPVHAARIKLNHFLRTSIGTVLGRLPPQRERALGI